MQNFRKGLGNVPVEYPITSAGYKKLNKHITRVVNPMIGKDHGYKVPDDFDQEEMAQEVLRVRADVIANKFPMWFMQKYYPFGGEYEFPHEVFGIEGLSIKDPKGLANVVHMDSPTDMPRMVLKWLTHPDHGQNANVKDWTNKHINFLETIPNMEESISQGAKRGLYKIFEMKSYFGVARPEEVLGENMTAYPEGSPNHPSYPAGHSGAAAGSITPILNNISMDYSQHKKALDTAYSWGQFRTLAGVHYPQDNIVGLMAAGLEKYMRKDVVLRYKKL